MRTPVPSGAKRVLVLLAGTLIAIVSFAVGPVNAAYAGTALTPCPTNVGIATSAHDWRGAIVGCARQNVGVTEWGTNCNAYTQALYGDACRSTDGWCADFVKWVWLNTLHVRSDFVDPTRIGSTADSIRTWSQVSSHVTWKATTSPVVGDVVVFGGTGHAGIVVAVSGTTITMIGGNVNNRVNQDTLSGVVGTYWGGKQLLGYASPDASWSNPFGNYEAASGGHGSVALHGWVIDGDGSGPIPVDVYVDGRMVGRYPANAARPDVASAYPTFGPNHGFWVSFPIGAGTHNACAYGINYNGTGTTNPLLGCRLVNVS